MHPRRLVPVLAVAALLSIPLAASAQDQNTNTRHSGFMMSGRILTPWIPLVSPGLDTLFQGTVALPRFILGAQIKDLGVGAGVNFFSFEDTTLFLLGPTVTYAVAKGPGGRTSLHLLGSFSFATGSSNDPSVDITAIGFDFGVLGRALLIDNFGIDVGITFDFLSITREDDGGDDQTDKGVQLVGFLGGTFIL